MFKKMKERLNKLKEEGAKQAKIEVVQLKEFVTEVHDKIETLQKQVVEAIHKKQKPVKEIDKEKMPRKTAIRRIECYKCVGTGFKSVKHGYIGDRIPAHSGEICSKCQGVGYKDSEYDITPDEIKLAGPNISIFTNGKLHLMFNVAAIKSASVDTVILLKSGTSVDTQFAHRTISLIIDGAEKGYALGSEYTIKHPVVVEPEKWFEIVSKAWKNLSKKK